MSVITDDMLWKMADNIQFSLLDINNQFYLGYE